MSVRPAAGAGHAELMDGVYRWQRHIYDLTRKYYLLGRDRLIDGLDAPSNGTALELGCGTGRNLALAARRYPEARFFGIDISAEMLATAGATLKRANLSGRVRLTQGDATSFDTAALFGIERFDRVFISYALSMIPGWKRTIAAAIGSLAPGGTLHIVDFGDRQGLPRWFERLLLAWLARFHVSPRDSLREVLESESERTGASLSFQPLYRGYAFLATVTAAAAPRPAPEPASADDSPVFPA
ncbi:class I SAM-dependent methyltransferase [Mesorhizobium sp. SP-1A]|uniref:class I SAM-dependent methyltransferase n=1 Tax=Mesorhizobium sp. SP-1A TaxID=3077840 RepID=UPI0028F6F8D6|nr:class I SAM-dependent methyltransferase [Mesorhizobium sp. SP-1A]